MALRGFAVPRHRGITPLGLRTFTKFAPDSYRERHGSRRGRWRQCYWEIKSYQISHFGNISLSLSKQFLRVVAKKTLRAFWTKHPDCEQQLKSWYQEANAARWKSPKDIKKEFPTASILTDNRVVFNIKGNRYRLIVKINYAYQMAWIRFIGTHAQYDKIDAQEI